MFTDMNASSSRRSTVRTRAREAATAAILDAAEAVAAERGLDAATIVAIAERAGVAVGTLYNYFPDRDGILAAIFTARRAAIEPRVAAAATATAGLPFEARLRGFTGALFAILDEQRRFLQLAAAADHAAVKIKKREPSLMAKLIESLEEILRAGAAKKRLPADQVAFHARLLHGAIRSLALWRVAQGEPFTGDADRLIDTWLHGLGPRS
jgi:AcrR family transcriptional regulator